MKKLILLLFIPFVFFGQKNYSYYAGLDSKSFQALELVHYEIDFSNIDNELLAAAIFHATNVERKKHERSLFTHSKSLFIAAQGHSEEMVSYGFFSHTSPIKGKQSMSNRLKKVGLENAYFAENIAESFVEKRSNYWSTATQIVNQWMNSSGHRKNILNSKYNYLGCGTYYFSKKQYEGYLFFKSTQNFSSINSKPQPSSSGNLINN
tara:strand:- start:37 stop:657 length:621 start_codon:yes stop_codon:yes gene_type:complete